MSATTASAQGGSNPRDELLPDLRPVAPFDVLVENQEGKIFLGFASNSENIGEGRLKVHGQRPETTTPTMQVEQLVQLKDGSERRYPGAGVMAFVTETDHRHWHWVAFMRYELRSAEDLAFVRPDVKSGFCIADRQQVSGFGTPRAFEDPSWCEFENQDALEHTAGISVGWGDPYAAILEGQQIELTGLDAGRYYVVHRSNPDRLLRESDYSNNEAASIIELSWPKRLAPMPRVKLLTRCDVVGGASKDRLRDTSESREGVCGLAGDDTIEIRSGFDDKAYGGPGNDRFIGRLGQALIDGEAGVDTADYSRARQPTRIDLKRGTAQSKPGTDRLHSIERALGGRSRDVMLGDDNDNLLDGGPGADDLRGRDGDDTLIGGPGNDSLDGGAGEDVLRGLDGNDTINSRDAFSDTVSCGRGFDVVEVDALDLVSRDCEQVLHG